MFSKKIQLSEKDIKKAVLEETGKVHNKINFLIESTDSRFRKKHNLKESEIREFVNKSKGAFINEKINLIILEHLVFQFGSKQQKAAYTEFKEIATKTVLGYVEHKSGVQSGNIEH